MDYTANNFPQLFPYNLLCNRLGEEERQGETAEEGRGEWVLHAVVRKQFVLMTTHLHKGFGFIPSQGRKRAPPAQAPGERGAEVGSGVRPN